MKLYEHTQPAMKQVGPDIWEPSGDVEPCQGCSLCDSELKAQYEEDERLGRLPF